MAAVSLAESQVPRMRKELNENCSLSWEDLAEKVTINVPMPISYIRKDLVEEFSLLEPFGKGNTRPVFAQRNLSVLGTRIFGKNRNVVKMRWTNRDFPWMRFISERRPPSVGEYLREGRWIWSITPLSIRIREGKPCSW